MVCGGRGSGTKCDAANLLLERVWAKKYRRIFKKKFRKLHIVCDFSGSLNHFQSLLDLDAANRCVNSLFRLFLSYGVQEIQFPFRVDVDKGQVDVVLTRIEFRHL